MREEHVEHQRIVDAISRHDSEAAMEAALDHVLRRGRELEAHLGLPQEDLRATEAEILSLLTPMQERIQV